ncbi:MAG: hypothetical protein HY897_12075 [Deltaproteobacteria bacterium]|nr:hypothetical protein [Deltaproteobacteria bacterium]
MAKYGYRVVFRPSLPVRLIFYAGAIVVYLALLAAIAFLPLCYFLSLGWGDIAIFIVGLTAVAAAAFAVRNEALEVEVSDEGIRIRTLFSNKTHRFADIMHLEYFPSNGDIIAMRIRVSERTYQIGMLREKEEFLQEITSRSPSTRVEKSTTSYYGAP